MKAVRAAGRSWAASDGKDTGTGVQLSEWERGGWTYHAKGRTEGQLNKIVIFINKRYV